MGVRCALPPIVRRSSSSRSKNWITDLLENFECTDASVGFRLADPYRTAVSKQREMSYGLPEHNPTVARLSAQSEGKRRFESVDAELNSPSSVTDLLEIGKNWKCRGKNCNNTNFASLEHDDDGALSVCPECGTTFEAKVMVSLNRQKNCPEEEDKTIVADAPSRRYEAVRTGEQLETATEARQRHLYDIGHTKCGRASAGPRSVAGLSATQAMVHSSTLRDMREADPIADAGEKKLRNVATTMQFAFDRHLSSLNPKVESYIRKTAKMIMHRGVVHAKVCNSKTCQISLLTRPNALIATCTIRACLERLASPSEDVSFEERLEAIAPECPKQDLIAALDKAKIIHIQNTGSAQRSQVAAVIDIILGWTKDTEPCRSQVHTPTQETSALSGVETLVLPPPMVSVDSSSSLFSEDATQLGLQSAISPTPGSSTQRAESSLWALRDAIYATAKIIGATPETHTVALGAIQDPAVVQWVATQNSLPLDVLGVAVLKAALKKLGNEDVTQDLMHKVCSTAQISSTTGNDAATLIGSLMPPELLSSPSDSLF